MSTDWDEVRKYKSSGERPGGWPDGVHAISVNGLALLGIHEKDNKLYWDGEEIVTKSVVSLGRYERVLAALAAVGTFGVFALELAKALGCWQN